MPSRTNGHSLQPGEIAHTIPGHELRRLVHSGANLLVRGEKSAATATVVALSADFPRPTTAWMAGTDAGLPAIECGTLVVHDVGNLDLSRQRALLAWLEERASRVRVITTTSRDLFSMVSAGLFLDQLYYRLNTIVVDAVGGDEHSAPTISIFVPPARQR